MTSPKVTAFTETAALWAVMNDDMVEARRIVDDMLPGERDEFSGQLARLADMLGSYCGRCGKQVERRELVTMVRALGAAGESVCRGCAGLGSEDSDPAYPAPGSEIPDQRGYVVGECGHRVAGSEWRAGCRTCERCPADGEATDQ